jgi:hypothetical protein
MSFAFYLQTKTTREAAATGLFLHYSHSWLLEGSPLLFQAQLSPVALSQTLAWSLVPHSPQAPLYQSPLPEKLLLRLCSDLDLDRSCFHHSPK